MGRRSFMAASASAAGLALAKPALSQGLREWRMVTAWPKGLPGVGTGAERLAERISAMSNGKLTVKVHAAGEIVPALQVFDAVSQGSVEMGHDASFYHLGKSKATAFFSAVPFGMSANETSAWIDHGGGQALWEELYEPFDLQPFAAGTTGTQMLGWFRHELSSIDDLQGLKMRMPGLGGAVLEKVGATVVLLPAGEIFPALQSGAIDAAEFIGPYNDIALGLHQVAKNYYSPGFQDSGTALECVVNKTQYNQLPKDLQHIVRVACQAGYVDMWGEYQNGSAAALQVMKNEHGVRLRRAPREVIEALGRATRDVLEEERANADPITVKIFDSWDASLTKQSEYTSFAEQAYLNARKLVQG
ncbi:ABC transporter substrate-binding protein [Notoacmeibacter marinus]|uniref:ABC transporter substrate-binding protein n=1 Tax=Notoacmeibacter marinus TaxID=1876515 RepID=A0A231V424_9HYPH|nr:ABC transporter substrate-binding protein [Notoacmeibacter marinus]